MHNKTISHIFEKITSISDIMEKTSNYSLQNLDELYGYMWLKPTDTNIDADIFIDDGGAYIRDGHIPLLFLRNGKERDVTEFIPISISEKPAILDKCISIKLDLCIINQTLIFIKLNEEVLLSFADNKIGVEELMLKLWKQHECNNRFI